MTDTGSKHFREALARWINRQQIGDMTAARILGISFFRLQLLLSGNYQPEREEMAELLAKIADTPQP